MAEMRGALDAERSKEITVGNATVLTAELCKRGSESGAMGEMVLCGFPDHHDGDCSWASLPTFTNGAPTVAVGSRIVIDGTVFEVQPGPVLAPVGEVFDMVDDEEDGDD